MFQSKYARGNKTGAQLKGLFENGQWKCDCSPRYPAISFEVKKPGPNQGKLFYTCAQEKRCGFFLWRHDAVVREGRAVLANSRTEPLDKENPIAPKTTYDSATIGQAIPVTAANTTAVAPTTKAHAANAARRAAQSRTPEPRPSLPPPLPPQPERQAPSHLPEDTPSRSSRSFLAASKGGDTTSFELTSDEEKALVNAEYKVAHDGKQQQQQQPAVEARPAAQFTTPSKRKYGDMAALESGSLPTPETHGWKRQMTSATRSGSILRIKDGDAAGLDELLNLVSPQHTPTPATRFRDAKAGAPRNNTDVETDDLWVAVNVVLQEEQVVLADAAKRRLQDVCVTHIRRSKGILQGRNILRKALNARDHKIALLEAELEVEREVIKCLRDKT